MKALNVQELLQTARQRTGLSDFGPPDFMEGLLVLVDGLNTEADIHPDRWNDLYERLQRLLINRLWFAKDMAACPEIADQDVRSPVVITSLPRTGSTKLHRMLGASTDFQTVPMWRTHMFARMPGLENGGKAERIQATRAYEQWMYQTSPAMITGHPMFTDEPEEDQWLGEATFRHTVLFGIFNSSSYAQWVMKADMRPTYDYFLSQIKYLQWQSGPGNPPPWLLKTPNHFGNEHHLTRIFKQPRFIVTHRDPAKCVPSITTTAMAFRKLYSDFNSTAAIGAGNAQYWSWSAMEHMAWRDRHPDIQVLDLSFREVTEDGVGTVRKVYDFLGMPLSDAAIECVEEWERKNPKDKHGRGVYSAAAMGSTEDEIRQAFAPYVERFAAYLD